jgi:hypothetical protein
MNLTSSPSEIEEVAVPRLKRYGNLAETTGKDDKRLAAVIRFPPELLKRVDAAAKARRIPRDMILMVASRAPD